MIEIVVMVAIFLAGFLLGFLFFGGLFWTIKRGLSARNPAVWFFGSWLIRIAVVLGVFSLISGGKWERLMVCTAGFLFARVGMIRWARMPVKPGGAKQEAGDAP